MFVALTWFQFQVALALLKGLIVLGFSVNIPPIMVWTERRAPALMQRRKGPNRVGLFGMRLGGLIQGLADTIKLLFKEEIVPRGASKFFYHLAPLFGFFPALLFMAAIPFGNDLVFTGLDFADQSDVTITVPLSVVQLDATILFVLAMTGMGVYAVALAGWASANKFSLLGALRASAQMVSYEIPMALALIPMVFIYDSLNLNEIAQAQDQIWKWGLFQSPVSFFIFLITMFAETNRAPFDLAEGESELVAGFHTEFGSGKFALFFLGEYVAMFALSAMCALIFLGGWQLPFISHETLVAWTGSQNIASLIGVPVLILKAGFFMWLFVWVRWTLPRFRYDQLMRLGWRYMLPIGVVNFMVMAILHLALGSIG